MAIFHSALEGENSVLLSRSLSTKKTDLTSVRRLLLSKLYIQKVKRIWRIISLKKSGTRQTLPLETVTYYCFITLILFFVSFYSALKKLQSLIFLIY